MSDNDDLLEYSPLEYHAFINNPCVTSGLIGFTDIHQDMIKQINNIKQIEQNIEILSYATDDIFTDDDDNISMDNDHILPIEWIQKLLPGSIAFLLQWNDQQTPIKRQAELIDKIISYKF